MEFDGKFVYVLILLHLVSWAYNALISYLERKGYHDGYVSLFVVAGVAYTVLAVSWKIGTANVLVLVVAFLASGLPMIIGSIARYINQRCREEQQLVNHARRINGNGH